MMETTIPVAVLLMTSIFASVVISQPAKAQDEQSIYEKIQFKNDISVDNSKFAELRLPFIENLGQIDNQVRFYANTFAGMVFVDEEGLTYTLIKETSQKGGMGLAVKERFLTQKVLYPIGTDRNDAIVNYFIGERESWYSNIPVYNAVHFDEVWPFIDVKLITYGKNVEKVFKINPGGTVKDIQLTFYGVKMLSINDDGELLLDTEIGTLAMTRPFAFQYINDFLKPVDVTYVVDGNKYGFSVGHYDPRYTLIIDPVLASTFVGGTGFDFPTAIALDTSGNVFITGLAGSGYPTTPGAFDQTHNGGADDVFVSKLNNDLTSLLASTFIGGSGADVANGVALDASGNVFITGIAQSGYPTTPGAFDRTFNGVIDVFISKLNNDLTSLLASTFVGGSDEEQGLALTLDTSGNVFITGLGEDGYPISLGAFDQTFNGGGGDVFVSKITGDLTGPITLPPPPPPPPPPVKLPDFDTCTLAMQRGDPVSMNTIRNRNLVKTIHAEKQVFNCQLEQGDMPVLIDVTIFAEIFEKMNTKSIIGKQSRVITCMKVEVNPTVIGCSQSIPSADTVPVRNCIEESVDHPLEMNTVSAGNIVKTMEAQKEVFLCNVDNNPSTGSPPPNDMKVDVVIFTEIWEDLGGLPADPVVKKIFESMRCVVKIDMAEVQSCQFSETKDLA